MPIKHKSTPGPRGESCLTCRRRRKKCDKGRPFCQRCLDSKGKFICLGYDDESEPEVEKPPRKDHTKAGPVTGIPSLRIGIEFGDAVPGSSNRTAYFGTPISAAEINDYLTPSAGSFMGPFSPKSLLLTSSTPPQDQCEQVAIAPRHKPDNEFSRVLPSSVPRRINADAQMRESYVFFVVEEYQSHRVTRFFKPPPISMRGFWATQMRRSRVMESMYLGAKIFESFAGKPDEVAIQSCSHWITRYANCVTNPEELPNPYPSAQEIEDKLNGLIELMVAQFIVLGTAVGYTSLRLALPSFLHLVSDDPSLLVEQGCHGLLCISLPALLTSSPIETRRFVFYDIMYSLLLGLPTLAEYDSAEFPIVLGMAIPIQWVNGVHGVPIEMTVNIAEVNNWRAQRMCADWGALEMRTLAWKWRQPEIHSEESVEMIYRVAIQETWRHTTLIYIYMGMCGVTSDDPRVQASVHQIVKLIGVVGDTNLDVQFSIPLVVAGIAAQSEPQRTFLLQKLKTFNGVRLWILRGRDFARVLKHLWDGPAVGGAAVGWDEYVQSRCKVLPIQ
ncbi:unnamed protein product [Rhizoctonia solani]|uniref:Zn(2)-C6 fungal-type domain-containing protein n=3 Tax=Rhizoctonia solani TaxID=456999 RepID=A0A8H3A4N1_9AGAM|nr:fungal zn(2)-cys(6) binuclear cluster domain protein, putative [Rhizoctonia solani AG-3 Rhs1AP]KEP51868.1 putative fungal zn(2)-cys(6) binuclear cluster domain protein [Rhizoctonia solani 123E]CAE6389053.1 unnamed protein product [Rhizoctonia solani]CAE6407142.1 unnamed protein product [Rhizoctonia solani]